MLWLVDLNGSIECTNDSADCVIDGQSSRGVIVVRGTASEILTIRALIFLNGQAVWVGGAYLHPQWRHSQCGSMVFQQLQSNQQL